MCEQLHLYKQRNIASYWSLQCGEYMKKKASSRAMSEFSGESVVRAVWEEV